MLLFQFDFYLIQKMTFERNMKYLIKDIYEF